MKRQWFLYSGFVFMAIVSVIVFRLATLPEPLPINPFEPDPVKQVSAPRPVEKFVDRDPAFHDPYAPGPFRPTSADLEEMTQVLNSKDHFGGHKISTEDLHLSKFDSHQGLWVAFLIYRTYSQEELERWPAKLRPRGPVTMEVSFKRDSIGSPWKLYKLGALSLPY